MANLQATCHTPDNQDADRRLQGLGGPGWWHTIDQIIAQLQAAGGHRYWTTTTSGQSAWVEVHRHPRSGRLYIKSAADGVEPNNLLALPRCA